MILIPEVCRPPETRFRREPTGEPDGETQANGGRKIASWAIEDRSEKASIARRLDGRAAEGVQHGQREDAAMLRGARLKLQLAIHET